MSTNNLPKVSVIGHTRPEKSKSLDFKFQLSSPAGSEGARITFTVVNQTTSFDDYQSPDAASRVVRFQPGQQTATVQIPIKDDAIDENNETFLIRIDSALGALIDKDRAIGTITDNDSAPGIIIEDGFGIIPMASDGTDTGSSSNILGSFDALANFKLRLTKPSGKTIRVKYTTKQAQTDEKSITAISGQDFAAVTTYDPILTSLNAFTGVGSEPVENVLEFKPGETEAFIQVGLYQDAGEGTNHAILERMAKQVAYQDWGIGAQIHPRFPQVAMGLDYVVERVFDHANLPSRTDNGFYAVGLKSDEVFSVRLSQAENAKIQDGKAQGTIYNLAQEPVLAFRGTNPTEFADILSDVNPDGIGWDQYQAYAEDLRAWAREASWLKSNTANGADDLFISNSVSMTGHSLGGALAQLAIADLTASMPPISTLIGANGSGDADESSDSLKNFFSQFFNLQELVTFNSPGLTQRLWRNFMTETDTPLAELPFQFQLGQGIGNALSPVTHYVASGDVVSLAGDEFIPGQFVISNFPSQVQINTTRLEQQYIEYLDLFSYMLERHAATSLTLNEPMPDTTHYVGPSVQLSQPDFTYDQYLQDPQFVDFETEWRSVRGFETLVGDLLDRQTSEAFRSWFGSTWLIRALRSWIDNPTEPVTEPGTLPLPVPGPTPTPGTGEINPSPTVPIDPMPRPVPVPVPTPVPMASPSSILVSELDNDLSTWPLSISMPIEEAIWSAEAGIHERIGQDAHLDDLINTLSTDEGDWLLNHEAAKAGLNESSENGYFDQFRQDGYSNPSTAWIEGLTHGENQAQIHEETIALRVEDPQHGGCSQANLWQLNPFSNGNLAQAMSAVSLEYLAQ